MFHTLHVIVLFLMLHDFQNSLKYTLKMSSFYCVGHRVNLELIKKIMEDYIQILA